MIKADITHFLKLMSAENSFMLAHPTVCHVNFPPSRHFFDFWVKMVKDFWLVNPPKKKLTWQWTITIFNRRYIFKWWIFHDFPLSYLNFLECSLKRNMINSHIKGQVNFGSSQSMPNESKYTHFSATRIPTQRKNKMLWKTCPTPFQNWLVRLNFIGDASLVIPFISGTIIRSWWNMVKSYQIVSIFFLLGTFLVASRIFF